MTAAGPKKYVVRLRWERSAYTSPAMPQHDAETRAADLEREIVACGDGPGFVRFTRFDGGTIRMRAREVIGVEAVPHIEREDLPPAGTGGTFAGATVSGVQVHVQGPASSGTDFLRHVAEINRAHR